VVLPNVWSGFQIVGEDSSLTSSSGATNAVLLGSVLLVLTTTINCVGVNWMSRINNIGVTCEIIGVIAVIGMFFTHAQRGPQVVFDTGAAGSEPGYIWAWIVSGLMAAYVMVGFGSAGELAEETRNPRRVAPRTIRLALSVSALGGGLMLVGALMAAPSLTDGRLASEGLPYVLGAILSSPWGTLLLIDVAIAVFVCTLAIQTAASRLMFSMARDGRLPASKTLSKVNARTGTPIAPSVLIGIACILVLAVNVGNSAIFTTLSSVCIVLIYLAYLMVTVPLLRRRLQGWPHGDVQYDSEGRKLFSLGAFGIPVNIAAVLYGAAMVINLSWPRAEIFNPSGDMPILQWAAPITVVAVVLVGALCYPRGKTVPNPVTIGATK
jgi:urea carboxylase system permease